MKRLFAKLLIWMILGALHSASAQIKFGPGPTDPGTQLDSIVAVVDEDVITREELDRALVEARQQIRLRGADAPPQNILERQVLEQLILQRLQTRAAEQRGIVVDDPSLNAAVEAIARQNDLTLDQLRRAVEQQGIDFADFRDDVRRQVQGQRLRQQVVDSQITVSEQEIDNALSRTDLGGGSREYRLAQILIATPPRATPDQIEQARKNAEQVLAELRRGADFQRVAAAISDGREALQGGELGWLSAARLPTIFAQEIPRLSPGEISEVIRSPQGFHIVKVLDIRGETAAQPVTQSRVRHILIRTGDGIDDDDARARLERLRQRIQDGEDFAELARANSMDTATAAEGGALGWLGPGEPSRAFAEAIAGLRPGDVSEPFRTAAGWHIAQVQERRQQIAADQAQRARVRQALLQRKAQEEWDLWLRQLRNQAYVEIRL